LGKDARGAIFLEGLMNREEKRISWHLKEVLDRKEGDTQVRISFSGQSPKKCKFTKPIEGIQKPNRL